MVMPWQNTLGMSIPASEVYKTGLKSPIVSKLILIGALCGLITTLNSFYVAGARVLLTLGRAKFIDEAFSKIHPKYKTPYFSNTIIAIITLSGPFVGKKLISPIITICSLGFMIAWLMVCLSSIKLKSESHVKSNIKSMTCIRYLSVGLSTLMIMILIIPSSPGALRWPFEWGLVGVWTMIGIILYIISNSRGSIISKEERQKQVMGEFYINKENM
jgi:amino acid transporter